MLLLGDDPVDPSLEEIRDAGRLQHLTAIGAGGDDRAPQAGVAHGVHEPHRPFVGLHAAAVDHGLDELVLVVTEACDRDRIRRVAGRALGEGDAA